MGGAGLRPLPPALPVVVAAMGQREAQMESQHWVREQGGVFAGSRFWSSAGEGRAWGGEKAFSWWETFPLFMELARDAVSIQVDEIDEDKQG